MTHNAVTPERILTLGHAYRTCRTLQSAVELGVFTLLAGGPLDRDTLSERAGINARGARDFLDALVSLGLLMRHGDGRYANSADTDLYLDRNKPTYVGATFESGITRHLRAMGLAYCGFANRQAAKRSKHGDKVRWALCRRGPARRLRAHHDRPDAAGGEGAGDEISLGGLQHTDRHRRCAGLPAGRDRVRCIVTSPEEHSICRPCSPHSMNS